MDFSITDEQRALTDLCRKIFDQCAQTEAHFDPQTWHALAEAGLLGISLKDDIGGSGLSLFDWTMLVTEGGRAAVDLPLVHSMVGAMAIDRFAEPTVRKQLLTGVVTGETVASAVLAPEIRWNGSTLTGRVACVPGLAHATHLVLGTPDGLFLVKADAPTRAPGTSTSGEIWYALEFEATEAQRMATSGDAWLKARTDLGLCAYQRGLSEGALELTAAYAKERTQFGKAIGSFQAVTQRIADAAIDAKAIDLTVLRAAHLLQTEQDAEQALAIAGYWAAEAGFRIAATAQHLHGGIGFDRDYPIHRFTLRSKNVELLLAGSGDRLERLAETL